MCDELFFTPPARLGHKGKPTAWRRGILELISMGAPFPGVLNKLCAAISLQIGEFAFHVSTGLVHILLVIGIVVLLFHLFRGRAAAA